jgi:hypothetical protein
MALTLLGLVVVIFGMYVFSVGDRRALSAHLSPAYTMMDVTGAVAIEGLGILLLIVGLGMALKNHL